MLLGRSLLLSTLLVVGCSSSSSDPPANTTTDAGTDAASSDLKIEMKLTIPAGGETHRCQLVQIPSKEFWVNGLEHHYTKGSHHFLLYSTTLKSIPAGEEGQTECPQGDEGPFKYSAGLLYATQTADGSVPFPEGVGMRLEPGAVYMMQSHYINPNKTPLDATATLTFHTTTQDKVKVRAAPFLFFNPFIYVAAKSKGKSTVNSCGVPADISILTAFSHYHQRGTKMTVYRDPDSTTESTNVLYTSTDWENPDLLKGPIDIKKGERIRFQCDYDNSAGAEDVIQGPRAAANEMCAFVGIYYPEQPSTPVGPGNTDFWNCGYQRKITEIGTKMTCMDLAQCLQTCPAADAPRFHPGGVDIGMCWQKCVNDSCPGSLNKVFPLSNCQQTKCAEECKSGNCLACLTSKCADEFNACSSHSCPAP